MLDKNLVTNDFTKGRQGSKSKRKRGWTILSGNLKKYSVWRSTPYQKYEHEFLLKNYLKVLIINAKVCIILWVVCLLDQWMN